MSALLVQFQCTLVVPPAIHTTAVCGLCVQHLWQMIPNELVQSLPLKPWSVLSTRGQPGVGRRGRVCLVSSLLLMLQWTASLG
jgi:hypothetical protein